MKCAKTLVALAALAAFGAQAQSSVTMTGYIDRAYTATDSSDPLKDAKAISSSAGTTGVVIAATEDLGGGMKVGASIGTDWAEAGGLTQDGAAANTSASAAGSFGNAQSFLFIEDAKLGVLRLGNVNNEILTAMTGVGSPFSTGVGSAYSSAFSTHDGYGTGVSGKNGQVVAGPASATNGGVRGIRQVNTVKYVSPAIQGFTLAYGMALKNDSGATAAVSTVGVNDMSIRYANGPLNVMYASLKYSVGSDAGINGTSMTPNSTNTQTSLAASYAVMPTLKVSIATGGSKASADSIANSTFTQYGAVYTMGQIDIMAQMASVNNKNAATASITGDRKMTGFGLNYNFSKTARAYVRYDDIKLADGAATVTAGSEIKRTAFGISKSF